MVFKFRRKETPWEVVDNHSVKPVPTYFEGKPGREFLVLSVGGHNMVGTYIFNVSSASDTMTFRRALSFSRKLLLEEASKRGFNVLISESWSFTILRNGQRHRVEIRYTGRPAELSGSFTNKQKPPFISTLDRYFLYV